MRRGKGFTLIELLVVIAIIGLLVTILVPGLQKVWELARRAVCATRLNAMGKGFTIYAGDNDQKMPWIPSADWTVATGTNAMSVAAPGTLSPTALMFLLVRTGQEVGLFICPSDTSASKMDDPKFTDAQGNKNYYWDFYDDQGGEHWKKVSYSMQAPVLKGTYEPGFTTKSPGALVIVADKTPAYEGVAPFKPATDWAGDLTDDEKKAGMSQNHSAGEFINVLHADSHVGDGKRADLGINKDNIYSTNTPPGPGAGQAAVNQHKSEEDTYLMGPSKAAGG